LAFVDNFKSEFGSKAMHRAVEQTGGTYPLRERGEAYNGDLGNSSEPLSFKNTLLWKTQKLQTDIAWSDPAAPRR
jgi:hypothetical protein